ncbi:hypothetical protein HYPSUDRAFT_44425 [Hypholoma sublateritium FD-334 SS-4]|uniref:F-box domain-containing protein n=1 Tax=Hypholoma sublateritium (strain FD-334 SS-4) TaxID=945553 RepID=A0A0D2M7K1_HYPSF|nr:hypothetical protein HYPSUDRAFT_44425 [Hypholoma sublateritium FD-334 SS-4]
MVCLQWHTASATCALEKCPVDDGQFQRGQALENTVDREVLQYIVTDTEDPPLGSKPFAEFPLVESLQAAHRVRRRKMNDIHDPFISRLPPEIASHIFTIFLPNDVENTYSIAYPTGIRPTTAITPLRLGAVCQAWREIAWSTPALWSSISIDMFATNKTTAEIVCDWLGRSGELPLYIRLYAGLDQGSSEYHPIPSRCEAHAQRVFDAVNIYANRWFYIDLELPTTFMQRVRCVTSQTAMVETLRINLLASEVLEPPLDKTKQIDLHGRLSPTNLLLHGLHLAQVGIQWNNLTHVEAFDLSIAECLDLLRMAPAMTHLILTRLSMVGVYNPLGQQLSFCHIGLRSLSLKAVYQYAAIALNAFFERTSFPALTQLSFEQVPIFSESETSVHSLLDHISRSATRLLDMKLKISTLPIDHGKVTAVLHALPTLETLALEFGRYGAIPCLDPFLAVLAFDATINGKIALPRLKSLTISKTRFSWDSLFQIFPPDILAISSCTEAVVQSNVRKCLSLLRIVLPQINNNSLDKKVVDAVSDLGMRGVKVQIMDNDGHNFLIDDGSRRT